ncbi:hypothetical protein ACRE_019870 [Hapsidospora chrysogenum ATCC 11550]|uniref:Uncharacterized protein n=1 Tax=Hapsidospora chrysogenum (strain ATCC 11550 / CBS 779.69 / DSM 880 / IAM 14645 / JCM 23072 / IMI 49137) TaxID=857340 RepID=A0A086TCS1_HAPC1|nr:hypothetical protein ACRE_019870 [Hapsidospora chrysogenum ATCC 11550]
MDGAGQTQIVPSLYPSPFITPAPLALDDDANPSLDTRRPLLWDDPSSWRFINDERIPQRLYDGKEVAPGDHECYHCDHVERFTDIQLFSGYQSKPDSQAELVLCPDHQDSGPGRTSVQVQVADLVEHRAQDNYSASINPLLSLSKPGDGFNAMSLFCALEKKPELGGYHCDANTEPVFPTEFHADIPWERMISPSDDSMGTCLNLLRPTYPSSGATATTPDFSQQPRLVLDEDFRRQVQPRNSESGPPVGQCGSGRHSLISDALDVLRIRVAESILRLRHIENQIADQLRPMSPEVVSIGLQTVVAILDRSSIDDPASLVCFVCLCHGLSMVIHGGQATKLFSQAVSYASWLSEPNRRPYVAVVEALWEPSGMDKLEAVGPSTDPLASIAQFFLDELEHSAIQETNRQQITDSRLLIQHAKDTKLDLTPGAQEHMVVDCMHNVLAQRYRDVPMFVSRLAELRNRDGSKVGSTARLLELELMSAGRAGLPQDRFFDDYVPLVQAQTDILYFLVSPRFNSRLLYYKLGVELVRSIINTPADPSTDTDPGRVAALSAEIGSSDNDGMIRAISPILDSVGFDMVSGFDSSSLAGLGQSAPDLPTGPCSESPKVNDLLQVSSTASTSSPSQVPPTHAINNSHKVGSNSFCEICGYRPRGNPRWFAGSMAKHKRLQHAISGPKIYRCCYPGCSSKFTNRADNLRQHMVKMGHFLDGEEEMRRRPGRRKKAR